MNSLLIADRREFERLMGQIPSLFQAARRLPDLVFQPGFGHYRVVDFDELFTSRMWDTMRSVSEEHGASVITCAVTDPEPEAYYYAHFGHYGVAQLPVGSDAEMFLDTVAYEPPSSPADAVIYNARVVLFYPDSAAWLCWGERDLGIAVFAFPLSHGSMKVVSSPGSIRCVTPAEALHVLVARNFAAHEIPRSFTETFLGHYGGG